MEEIKKLKGRVQHKGKTEAEWYLDVYYESGNLRENPFIPLKDEIIIFEKDENNEVDRLKVGDGETNVMDLPFASSASEFEKIELPEKWYELNEKIEEIAGDDGHPIMGGLVYKDMNGNTRVYPIAPAYGVRREETGGIGLDTVVLYNSAQQILCKGPTTDNRHVVNLHYLNAIFGGGDIDVSNTKTFSIQKVPPVDTTVELNERRPYVFCRDSENKFSGKVYSIKIDPRTLVERDDNGNITVNNPTSGLHPVTLEYLQNALNSLKNPAELAYNVEDGMCTIKSAGVTLPDTLHLPRFLDGYEVTKIGARAFKQNTDLKEIIVSASVTEIEIATFYGCTNLKYVSFDKFSKFTTLGASVFEACTALNSVEIPNGTTSIGMDAFNGCSNLDGITIPASVQTIGRNAFANCGTFTLTFEGITPPVIEQGLETYTFNVKVPKGTLSTYKNVPVLANCTFEEYGVSASYPRAEEVGF